MSCTTLLVGRKATNDGSTIVARNEDTGDGTFEAKKMIVVEPQDQPRTYTGVASHLTMELPNNPLRYVCVPNADPSQGVWGEAGINAANVSMSATETISTNARVLAADPLIVYQPAQGKEGEPGYVPERPGGIGEENHVTIILPYIQSAKQGVEYMGSLLEKYGTYENNGVAFGDEKEVWYIETIGGHHWIARRVPDDCYVPQPNRQGIDWIDLRDALGPQKDFMCSKDLPQWMADNNLCMVLSPDEAGDTICGIPVQFNPRYAFSSFRYLDLRYNNARAWYMCSMFNRNSPDFKGPDAKYGPMSFDVPWCVKPEYKLSVLDVKNMLSSTYDGTDFDCYGNMGTPQTRHMFRDIGINRTSECSILNIRPNAPRACRSVQWYACGSNPFTAPIAIFTNVHKIPEYLDTTTRVTSESYYWQDRLVAALADPEFFKNVVPIYTYQQNVMAAGYKAVKDADMNVQKAAQQEGANAENMDDQKIIDILEKSNAALADYVKAQNDELLAAVLFTRSLNMRNAFGASDM